MAGWSQLPGEDVVTNFTANDVQHALVDELEGSLIISWAHEGLALESLLLEEPQVGPEGVAKTGLSTIHLVLLLLVEMALVTDVS